MIKIKVIKAHMDTCWYHDQIGQIFYTDGIIVNRTKYHRFTEFGVKLRFLFEMSDVEIIE